MNSSYLKDLIYKSFLSSSIIPIIVIELALLGLYFGINSYIATKNKAMLLSGAKSNISEIISREAGLINSTLEEISNLAKLTQTTQQYFFENFDKIETLKKPKFAVAPNGVYYKVNKEGSSIYYSKDTNMTTKTKQKAVKTEEFDVLFQKIVDENKIVVAGYFNSFDNMNRYYPFIDSVYTQYPPNLVMQDFNFYYEANQTNNPKREPVWTNAYLDPAGMGWLISCIVPIYNKDFLEGVTGFDVTIDSFIKNILDIKLPWNSKLFLVGKDGTILALPEAIEELFDLKELKEHTYSQTIDKTLLKPEEFNIFKNKNQYLVEKFKELFLAKDGLIELELKNRGYLLSSEIIEETAWRVFMIIDKDVLFEPIYLLEKETKQFGYIAIAVMLLFYFVFFIFLQIKSKRISKHISNPIEELAELTKKIGNELEVFDLKPIGIQEIDSLYVNFNNMSSELNRRTNELIQSQIKATLKEKEAQIAYSQGLFESASSYLHNIGNSLSGIDSKILHLKKILNSMDNYNMIFKKLRDSFSQEDLDRFEEILLNRVKPSLVKYIDEIYAVREHMVQTIRHQQDVFKSSNYSKEKFIQDFEINSVIDSILEDFEDTLKNRKIKLTFNKCKNSSVKQQKHQFIQGFINIIKNSIEAIDESSNQGEIDISTIDNGDFVEVRFSDNGIGISKENMPNMLQSGFSTKSNGHGLGLHSFNNFLLENGSKLSVESDGIDMGATFIMEIKR